MEKIEIIIYLIIALLCNAYLRTLSGKKNGVFYGKNFKPLEPKLEKFIKNIHFIETPAWYSQFTGVFFFCFAIIRLMNPEYDYLLISKEILICLGFTLGSSSLASWHFQGWINIGAGSPWEDPNENKKSEFAITLFSKSISFWWSRPWYYKRRRLAILWGVFLIFVSIYSIIKFI